MEDVKGRRVRLGKQKSQYEYLEDVEDAEDVALIGDSENGSGTREVCNVRMKSHEASLLFIS